MRVERIQLRDFRNYEAAEVEPAAGLTVVAGANGAGKTNLLEAIYFGCTARSPRTSNERELVRRGGEGVARVVLDLAAGDGEHRIEVGFQPGEAKHLRVDGSSVDSLAAVEARPLVSVFLPERLELVKGAPASRRAHLDQVVAALWPGRAETRRSYSRALAQRNALVARIRAGSAGPGGVRCGARGGVPKTKQRPTSVGRPLRGADRGWWDTHGPAWAGAGGGVRPSPPGTRQARTRQMKSCLPQGGRRWWRV